MSRARIGILVGSGLALAVLFVALLLETPGEDTRAGRVLKTASAPEQPHFAAAGPAAAAPQPAAQPLVVPEAAASAALAATSGGAEAPIRRVSGQVLRASDDTPLEVFSIEPLPRDVAEVGLVVDLTSLVLHADTLRMVDPGRIVAEDPEGRFEVSVPATTTGLRFHWGGGDDFPERHAELVLPTGDPPPDVTGVLVVLDTGFRVEGVVTDGAGLPLAGATVLVDEVREARTDELGRFLARDIAPAAEDSAVTLVARAPGFQRASADVIIPADVRAVPFAVIELAGSGAVEGRVTDRAGQTLGGVEVRLRYRRTEDHGESADERLTARTGLGGEYRVDHVPEGRYVAAAFVEAVHEFTVLTALDNEGQSVPQPAERWAPDVSVTTGRTTRLDWVLDQGASLRGRVVDGAGTPVAGASVRLERLLRWPAPAANGHSVSYDGTTLITTRGSAPGGGETVLSTDEGRTSTGDDGRFVFERVAPGEKLLTADDAAGAGLVPASCAVVVVDGVAPSEVELVLVPGQAVRGWVVDEAGLPLEGAWVDVKDDEASVFSASDGIQTNEQGRFAFEGLPLGTKRLLIGLHGFAQRFEMVEPGGPEERWLLHPVLKIHGRVLDAFTGEPVREFDTRIETENMIMSRGVQSHADGSFETELDGDVRCVVTVMAPGYEEQSVEDVLPSETLLFPLVFRLPRLD